MAQYEVRAEGKKTVAHSGHDKPKVIEWAEKQTEETGTVYEVYEIKHVHLTSSVKKLELAFF